MHHSIETNENKRKPEMIAYYNATKCGVDLIDMKCAVYFRAGEQGDGLLQYFTDCRVQLL